SLDQARKIIESRVNGLGVSGAKVVTDGDNLVITVPGSDGEAAKSLGQTAKLTIRPVLQSQPITAAGAPGTPGAPAPAPSAPGGPAAPSSPDEGGGASGEAPGGDTAGGEPAPQSRVYPLAAPGDDPAGGGDSAPAGGESTPAPAPSGDAGAESGQAPAAGSADAEMTDKAREEIEAAK